MDTIKVGILGYGLSGSVFHGPLLDVLDEYQISKIMTSRTEEVKRDFPDAEVVHELEEITNDPAIELVIVTTRAAFITSMLWHAYRPENML